MSDSETPAKIGRPSKYREEFAQVAQRLCLLGFSNRMIAHAFDVAPSTVSLWLAEIPEFSDAVAAGREGADAEVVQSLYREAVAGDVRACQFWLKNRLPALWREKHEVQHAGVLSLSALLDEANAVEVEHDEADQLGWNGEARRLID